MTDISPPPTNDDKIAFLVCVDEREESLTALRLTCIKARKRDSIVHILHVIEPPEGQSIFGVSDTMREEQISTAHSMLSAMSNIAQDLTGHKPEMHLKEGHVGDTIIHTAQDEMNANMLVLGVSAGGSRGKLIAWLSTQLGEKLWMPMLLVPGNLTDQQLTEIS